jgi:hypothetical protein
MKHVTLRNVTDGSTAGNTTTLSSHQRGCYITTITAGVQLKKKMSGVVGLKGLDAKTNCLAVNCQSGRVLSPVGLGTKNHRAGDGQQQFAGMNWLVIQWQATPKY